MRIPANVTYIGYNAFDYCESLTSVTFEDENNWSMNAHFALGGGDAYKVFYDTYKLNINFNADFAAQGLTPVKMFSAKHTPIQDALDVRLSIRNVSDNTWQTLTPSEYEQNIAIFFISGQRVIIEIQLCMIKGDIPDTCFYANDDAVEKVGAP